MDCSCLTIAVNASHCLQIVRRVPVHVIEHQSWRSNEVQSTSTTFRAEQKCNYIRFVTAVEVQQVSASALLNRSTICCRFAGSVSPSKRHHVMFSDWRRPWRTSRVLVKFDTRTTLSLVTRIAFRSDCRATSLPELLLIGMNSPCDGMRDTKEE